MFDLFGRKGVRHYGVYIDFRTADRTALLVSLFRTVHGTHSRLKKPQDHAYPIPNILICAYARGATAKVENTDSETLHSGYLCPRRDVGILAHLR